MKIDSNFIIICPACGYSFKKPDIKSEKTKFTCPMCRYIFKDNNDAFSKFNDFTI